MLHGETVDRGRRAFRSLILFTLLHRFAIAAVLILLAGPAIFQDGPAVLWHEHDPGSPAFIALGIMAMGLTVELWQIGLELVRVTRLRSAVRAMALPPTPQITELAEVGGLAGRVELVEAAQPYAFTYGLWRPRVVLSTRLLETVPERELLAVLTHEAEHVRGRDPLRLLIIRVLVARHFYLPALRHLRMRFVTGRELAADRRAIAEHGVRPLASALLQVLEPPRWAGTSSAAMAQEATIEVRIRQLEYGREPRLGWPSRTSIAVTLVIALVVGGFAVHSASSNAHNCDCGHSPLLHFE